MEKEVVFAERKLITYVYTVGKQPTSNVWYKTMENGMVDCENFGLDTATCFKNVCIIIYQFDDTVI